MDYKKIMCKFCKKCIGENMKESILKVNSKVNSDVIVIKCDNYNSKVEYEGNMG